MENNESVLSKCSLNEILDQSTDVVYQSILRTSNDGLHFGTCESDSHSQIKQSQCTVHSTTSEALGKRKQLFHSEEHQEGRTPNCVKGKEESHVSPDDLRNPIDEHCFLGSFVYYGGPDELFDISHGRKEAQNEVKMAVKQLEDATDPFNLECTTRGNWWEGNEHHAGFDGDWKSPLMVSILGIFFILQWSVRFV